MQFRVYSGALDSVNAGALVVPVFADGTLDGTAAAIDLQLGGAAAEILSSHEIAGKTDETALIHAKDRATKRVLIVGLGQRKTFAPALLARYAGTAVRFLGKRGVTSIAFGLPLEAQPNVHAAAGFIAEGVVAAIPDTTAYRTDADTKRIVIDDVQIVASAGSHTFDSAALEAGLRRGQIVGEAVNLARSLALTPANDMTPSHLAKRAEAVATEHGLEFHALDEAQMEAKAMGAILGVSRGSAEPAKMIVLEYRGDPNSTQKLAFVGKGLTFDSGGISLKPAERMHEMKYDMSGGAGVIAAMSAIAQLRPKLNVIGVVPASENLPGSRAMKPGDILRAMNGKTIEVINTDAEGRLILADGLCYARELGATKIVDAATLTGSMVVSLGHAATGVMSNDDAFAAEFLAVANQTGERYWRLPIFDDYHTAVKSDIADLVNSTGRPAGSLTAAAFLSAFVADTPWIHLDIAGTAYLDKESAFMAKGPTGVPVRGFVALAEELAKAPASANNASAVGAGR